jgi:hypothetical protein
MKKVTTVNVLAAQDVSGLRKLFDPELSQHGF